MTFIRRSLIFTLVLLSALLLLPASAESGIPTVNISAESLTDWTGKDDKREAELTYSDPASGIAFTQRITIKPQGTSSLGYPKHNFTIALQDEGVEMQPGWGMQTEYCLKANYIDPTHACNVVSARLAAQMNAATGLFENLPNRGAIDGFSVWVTLNGEDEGLYTWNIPKAAWMLGMDEANENHIAMCCEGWTEGCILQSDSFLLDEDWSIEVGSNTSKTIVKFDRLVDFIVNSSDEEFREDFEQYLNLDACLNYYCFMCISNANDNEAKNMLMVTWDGQIWQPMLYDLDSLWSIQPDGKALTTDIALSLVYGSNRLFQRIWEHFNPELQTRYAELRSGVLSEENIRAAFDAFADGIPSEMPEWDNQRWNPDGEFIRTYTLMWEQMEIYLPQVDAEFGYAG